MMRVLVTGSTGFVGGVLCDSLSQAGHFVRVAVRREPSLPVAASERVIVGNIDADTVWGDALRGMDCVIHMAAHVHVMNPGLSDASQFHRTNVLGTECLASAAVNAGVKRFIFLSSVKVNGESTHGAPFKSNDQPRPIDDYGRSKWEAERRLFSCGSASGMKTLAIRSPLVYGPHVKANFLRLMSWVNKGVPLPLGSVSNRRSMVSVWNLCDLIEHIVAAPAVDSGVAMVSDGEDISTADLVRRLAHVMDRPARLLAVPIPVLKLVGKVAGIQGEISRLCDSLTVDIGDTTRKWGWRPSISLSEGLMRTAQWYLGQDARR